MQRMIRTSWPFLPWNRGHLRRLRRCRRFPPAPKKSRAEAEACRQASTPLLVDRPVRIAGSAKELRSAFANLANNAVRYTPTGSCNDAMAMQ